MLGTTPDSHEHTLAQTEAALDGDLTAITPSAAVGLLDHWQTECASADTDVDLGDVSAGLGELRDLLAADALDGRAIGDALRSLAQSTRAVAAQTPDERLTPRLERIATLLARAASALGA